MGSGEFDICRDLEYHGYTKTLAGLQNFEKALMERVKRKPLQNHFGAPCGFYRDQYRSDKRALKKTRRKIAELITKEQTP